MTKEELKNKLIYSTLQKSSFQEGYDNPDNAYHFWIEANDTTDIPDLAQVFKEHPCNYDGDTLSTLEVHYCPKTGDFWCEIWYTWDESYEIYEIRVPDTIQKFKNEGVFDTAIKEYSKYMHTA